MEIANRTDYLVDTLRGLDKELQSLEESVVEQAILDFEIGGGCTSCRGRGWVVSWDTMDSMSGCYHESGQCTAEGCTHESRTRSGLHPTNNKYDSFHINSKWEPVYSDEESQHRESLRREIKSLKMEIDEERTRFTPAPGKIIKIVKSGRGPKKNRVPTGIVGLVKKSFMNNWGSTKLIVIDKEGQKWWPKVEHVIVIDPDPDMKPWDDLERAERQSTGYPVVATIKKKSRSGKASFIRTTTGAEMWVPTSQAHELIDVKQGQTVSIMLPMWLAVEKGLIPSGGK